MLCLILLMSGPLRAQINQPVPAPGLSDKAWLSPKAKSVATIVDLYGYLAGFIHQHPKGGYTTNLTLTGSAAEYLSELQKHNMVFREPFLKAPGLLLPMTALHGPYWERVVGWDAVVSEEKLVFTGPTGTQPITVITKIVLDPSAFSLIRQVDNSIVKMRDVNQNADGMTIQVSVSDKEWKELTSLQSYALANAATLIGSSDVYSFYAPVGANQRLLVCTTPVGNKLKGIVSSQSTTTTVEILRR